MRYRVNELRSIILEAMINAYNVLGIPQNASEDEIKKAYRKKAIEFHPDRNPGKDTTSLMVQVNAAYEILKDPSKRRRLDDEIRYAPPDVKSGQRSGADASEDLWKKWEREQRERAAARQKQAAPNAYRGSPNFDDNDFYHKAWYAGASRSDREDYNRRKAAWQQKKDAEKAERQRKASEKRARAEDHEGAGSKQSRQKAEDAHKSGANEEFYRDNYKVGDILMDRRFEFVDMDVGKRGSVKFYQVGVFKKNAKEYNVRVQYGRIGSKGRIDDEVFTTATGAMSYAEKKIAEKKRKGYKENEHYYQRAAGFQAKQQAYKPGSGKPEEQQKKAASDTQSSTPGNDKTRTVYGRKGNFKVHTRVNGQVYGNGPQSKAKPGDKLNMNVAGNRLHVKHPTDGWTQDWDKE